MIEFTAGTAIGGNIKINEFYTSEVEWLGSNGQATIATGTYPHDIWQVRFTFSYSKWAQYGNVFYSTYEGESRRYLRLILYSSDSNKGYFNYKSGTALTTPTLNKNTQYDKNKSYHISDPFISGRTDWSSVQAIHSAHG